jgi:hypothetical protein
MTTPSTLRQSPYAAAVAVCVVVLGCGGGSSSTPGTGGGSGSGGPAGSSGNLNAPCSLDTRVGGFAVQLVEMEGNAPYVSIGGGVRNGVLPADVWQQKGAAAGGCRLMVGPMLVCTTPCTNPQICAGQNQCIDSPALQGLGVVTVTGVGPSPIAIEPMKNSYSKSLLEPYPPFTPGAPVRVQAAGDAIPAFTLDSVGIEPLAFAGTGLTMMNGQALAFTWTAPATAGASRIYVKAEVGHHGGTAAHIDCDLPDTGSGELPATLVSALIAEGVHGFPTLSLTRRTIASAMVGGNCIDLAIAAPVERSIGVCPTAGSCIVSCDPSNPATQCPTSQTCKADYTCG